MDDQVVMPDFVGAADELQTGIRHRLALYLRQTEQGFKVWPHRHLAVAHLVPLQLIQPLEECTAAIQSLEFSHPVPYVVVPRLTLRPGSEKDHLRAAIGQSVELAHRS